MRVLYFYTNFGINFLSREYLPGPAINIAMNTIINSRAWLYCIKPSPCEMCDIIAIPIIPISMNVIGRCTSPNANKIPPTDSVNAARKPQNAGAKLMPTLDIDPPNHVQVSIPPIILGNP